MTAYGPPKPPLAMKLGAFDYVLKPFDVPKLRNSFSRLSSFEGHESTGDLRGRQRVSR